MAVTNNIMRKTAEENIIEYTAGDQKIKLTKNMVKSFLISGDPSRVSDQELTMFMMLCKSNHLNPWAKEAYCIKYGSSPASMVIGAETFQKRAESNPSYDGMKSGIIVLDEASGEIEYRNGMFYMKGEKIVGGWAEVFRKDRSNSTRVEVSMDEYIGRKSSGEVNSQWKTKPATMIRKVAKVQALREAFPSAVSGIYTAEEQGIEENAPVIPATVNNGYDAPSIPEYPSAESIPAVDNTAASDYAPVSHEEESLL